MGVAVVALGLAGGVFLVALLARRFLRAETPGWESEKDVVVSQSLPGKPPSGLPTEQTEKRAELNHDEDTPHPVWDPPIRASVEPPPKIVPKYVHTETLTRRQMIAEMGGWKRLESMTDSEIRSESLKVIENEYVL